ncbi:MAG: (2Fe-2S)-binding protein [Acidobacteriota bacterium]|jgi:NADH-quinone oxidoreductase subunit G/NADP-reducing hydrogenase subunit HndD|nr:(2Fe-2S)-binding protein [Acidobacteriota bacterium]
MEITVNGKPVECDKDDTVLDAASRAGVHIPHLCALDVAPAPHASCRVCLVEVEGEARLQTSCTMKVREGLRVRTHSPKVLRIRRNIVELLLAGHPDDCLYCARADDCELSRLAALLDVRERRYAGRVKDQPIDVSSVAIVRDPSKCILCGRCVTVCQTEQGVGAIDFAGRGFDTSVRPGGDAGLDVSDCVFCGQCVRVCPTGALGERSAVAEVSEALGKAASGRLDAVAQIAPAVPATLAAELGLGNPMAALELVTGALRQIGFSAVYDTSFAADLTVMEEAHELLGRLGGGGPLPMFTSCSPAWVRFVELHRPEFVPHLSTCKSPQQMAAALIKERAAREGRDVYSVAVMPCTAKKQEAFEVGDLDAVLTTRELLRLLKNFGVEPGNDAKLRSRPDAPFGEASGAGRLFGGSGGVMEAALRTAAHMAGAETPPRATASAPLRSGERIRTFTAPVGGRELRCAVASGLGAAKSLLDQLAAKKVDLDFVEVMSCPGGCIGGGGQPRRRRDRSGHDEMLKARRIRIHDADKKAPLHAAHENPEVARLYEEWLGAPGGGESHRLLHRGYNA